MWVTKIWSTIIQILRIIDLTYFKGGVEVISFEVISFEVISFEVISFEVILFEVIIFADKCRRGKMGTNLMIIDIR